MATTGLPYVVNWSNSNLKPQFTIQPATVDSLTTSLSLFGRNFENWGEKNLENFLHLLEHFASNTAPANPTSGQIWYDSSTTQLSYYSGTAWILLSSDKDINSLNPPTVPFVGQLWESSTGSLFFWNSTEWSEIQTDKSDLFIKKSGDTMQGYLTLVGDPATDLHAVPLNYLNRRFSAFDLATGDTRALISSLDLRYVPIGNNNTTIITGKISSSYNNGLPTSSNDLVTQKYVDTKVQNSVVIYSFQYPMVETNAVVTLPAATPSSSGCMIGTDKAKLNSISGSMISAISDYDISFMFLGKPQASIIVGIFIATRPLIIPPGCTGSQAFAHSTPALNSVMGIYKNDVLTGSVVFNAGIATGDFSAIAGITLAIGDVLTVKSSSYMDDTLADISIVFQAQMVL